MPVFRFIAVVISMILLGCVSEKKSDPPNIVVVLVDDMRWDEYSAAGHSFIKTPNIDRIASEGITFKNAFATTPLCSPSRASFLTGQYAHTNGITDNTARNEQSHKLNTFPKMLHDAGFETAFMGKWHMGNDDSPRPGFDQWISLKGQGEAIDPQFNINGEQKIITGYVTDILTEYSLAFINKAREKPFLLYMSHKALHPNVHQRDDGSVDPLAESGFIAAERHTGMYANKSFNRRPNHGIPPLDKPALMRRIGDLPPLGLETATTDKTIQERSEMLMAVDEGLGKILNALEKNGQLENTIVVFTSDHGYWYGEHGLDEERRLAYEEAIRIPMLIRYPKKVQSGGSRNQTVLNIDLAPTLLELAGVAPSPEMDGLSMLPVINNAEVTLRKSFLIEYYSDIVFPRMLTIGYKAVRNDRYKYIRYNELEEMDELYDLQQDPYELKNIINDSGSQLIRREMSDDLTRLLNEKP